MTSNDNGQASITFTLLTDNTTYQIFVSAECPLPFEPRLALADNQVLTTTITTQLNPNLIRNQEQAILTILNENPTLGEEAQKLSRYVEAQKKIHGVDKTEKKRKHN